PFCSSVSTRPHYVVHVLDAETRSLPCFARTELRTSASPAGSWSHLSNKCGTRAFAQVAATATVFAPFRKLNAASFAMANGGERYERAWMEHHKKKDPPPCEKRVLSLRIWQCFHCRFLK